MADSARVFLDTSALFAGVWSPTGGARLILKLGEMGAVRVVLSPQVLAEADGALRRKRPEALGLLALLLNRSQAEVTPSPSVEAVESAHELTGHRGDAQILAAARTAQVDFLTTLDRVHFLDNPTLRSAAPFPIGTPGDFLTWFRDQLSGAH